MARKTSKRVILNREALDQVRLGMADGMLAIGNQILAVSHPRVPDAPPLEKGLIDSGGCAVWVDNRKIGGQASKPKGTRSKGIVLAVGYGAPHGHFLEFGTVKMAARPFFSPTVAEVVPGAAQYIKIAVGKRIGTGKGR